MHFSGVELGPEDVSLVYTMYKSWDMKVCVAIGEVSSY